MALPSHSFGADINMPFGQKAFEIYKTSVEMRTADGQHQVPALARYLASEFKKRGLSGRGYSCSRNRGYCGACRQVSGGDGSSDKKPISISAHMDVVDALREDWERDPFTLVEENGYYFGRGTVDDKLGMTAVTAGFLRLKAEGWVPGSRPHYCLFW